MNKTFALAQVKAAESDNPNGEFEVILSAPTLDRDGEVIDAKAFEPLPDHITFDIDHGLSTATTVGSGQPYYDGDLLKVKGTFASTALAQEVRTLVAEGHIRTTSVAFMDAKKQKKDGITHITRAEILNGSFVPVPSNREAAVLIAKSIQSRKPETKSVIGSFEERRDLLQDAVRAEFSEADWCWIRATFEDNVIVDVAGMDGERTVRVSYTITDSGVIALGTVENVAISEIVRPVEEALLVDAQDETTLGSRSADEADTKNSTAEPVQQSDASDSVPAEVGGTQASRVTALLAGVSAELVDITT